VISTPMKPDAPPGTPPGGRYALGWGETDYEWAAGPLLTRGGSNGKNLAHVYLEPGRDAAMVLLTNIAGTRADDGLRALAAELYKRFVAPPAAAVKPPTEPSAAATPTLTRPKARFSGDTRRGKGL
jgi:hypothetical protein